MPTLPTLRGRLGRCHGDVVKTGCRQTLTRSSKASARAWTEAAGNTDRGLGFASAHSVHEKFLSPAHQTYVVFKPPCSGRGCIF